jgi:hypothetical protein
MSSKAMRFTSVFLVASLVAACAEVEPDVGDLPAEGGKEDAPGFTVTGGRGWYLVGNALTTGDDTLKLAITAPTSTRFVDLWLDGHYVRRARKHGTTFKVSADIADLPPGDHVALLQADAGHVAISTLHFKRSHPLYVAVSNDWDDPDNGDDKLERQERLHDRHPHLVITHFVGPYTFTDPAVTPARAQLLADWVKGMRDHRGDEIGLHVHPWCSFVRAAGVTCRTSPSFAYANGDTTGYTVRLDAYTGPELDKLFAKASELFVAHGLNKPTSFRAGGWTAETHVLDSLGKAGHVADSSGCNWARLEEWEFEPGATIYQWNKEHWSSIDETSQPYYPSTTDMQADAAPHLPILEVPDNGALVDYVTTAEMVEMFAKNFTGAALDQPTEYAIGYHPPNFSEALFQRIDGALTEIDRHLAVDGAGPVVYARMSDLPKAFPRR